jgi:outer membrane protein assembly factor BamD
VSHRRTLSFALVLVASGCSRGPRTINLTPGPTPTVDAGVSRAEVDSLWRAADRQYRHGRWGKAQPLYQRLGLELPSNDPLLVQVHFRLGETFFGQRDQLQAAREFRRVSDETPSDPLAPLALLRAGDAYADLWRRPELDPTYGSTALATYRELLSRYADSPAAARAQRRIADLEELFARKEFKAAQYYLKLKAWDSAILYLKDLVATYPRTTLAPEALLRLVHAYRVIGYQEDLQETCGYVRRFHADYPGAAAACPAPKGEGS